MIHSDAKEIERLFVHKKGDLCGILLRTPHGASFQYTANYLEQHTNSFASRVALHFPLRDQPFEIQGVNLHPFFAGLLPEGLRLKALIQSAKTAADDLFTLLAISGNDTIGDVSLSPQEENLPLRKRKKIPPAELNFKELLEESMHAVLGGEALRVAGIQPKVSAALISLPLTARWRSGAAILKLENPEFPCLLNNEHFFMQLAARCGLKVPKTEMITDSQGQAGLLVERFDRYRELRVHKALHQEDACQVLNIYPSEKYRISFAQVADAISEYTATPVIQIGELLKLVMYSYLICNGDLHAKNISMIEDRSGTGFVLSPAYNLLATIPYGDQTMALKMLGRDKNFNERHFIEFGQKYQVPEKVTRQHLQMIIDGISQALPKLSDIGLDLKRTRHCVREIKDRIAGLH